MKSVIVLLGLVASFSVFTVETNKQAPDFTLKNSKGADITLSQFKGRTVVLEWLNHGCPFVRKHYDSGNMQALQKNYVEKGVVWLSIISSAPGKQGYVTEDEAKKEIASNISSASNVLLDPKGTVGIAYGAKTTPHMYVINKDGRIVYQGAIDDRPDTNQESVPGAKNYVSEALNLTLSGKPVSIQTTKAYGCSVKYE